MFWSGRLMKGSRQIIGWNFVMFTEGYRHLEGVDHVSCYGPGIVHYLLKSVALVSVHGVNQVLQVIREQKRVLFLQDSQ